MPAVTLALNAVTATTATFNVGALAADGTLELQLSARQDFQFCVAPIYVGLARASPYVAPGLNQDARYYARMRSRRNSGAAEDWSNTVGFKTPVAVARDLTPPAIVADNAIIMRPEPIISFTAANEVAGYPGKNVHRDAPVAWRSVAAGGIHQIVLEHSGTPIDTVAILNTNLPEAATVIIYGGDLLTDITVGPSLYAFGPTAFRASPNMPGRPGYHGLMRLPAPITYRFIGVRITTPAHGTPGDMIHVEHVAIGLNRRSKNIAVDSNESPVNLGSKDRTRSGTPDRVPGLKMRHVEFDIAFLTETQSETLYQDVMGWMDDTVFIVPNSKAGPYLHDRLLLGDLKGTRRTAPSSIHHTRTFLIDSLV